MNRFLSEECFWEQKSGLNTTYLLYYRGKLAAFCSICADKISLSKSEQQTDNLPRHSVPAVKIARLGRDVQFKGYGFGKYMLDFVHRTILEAREVIGVRYMTLDAYPNKVSYYESLGYVRNANQGRDSATVSMRKDIFSD